MWKKTARNKLLKIRSRGNHKSSLVLKRTMGPMYKTAEGLGKLI